jgi:heme-degrading monooxygenase HmoA
MPSADTPPASASGTAFAATPMPPYYAVIFTSQRNGEDAGAYAEAAARMLVLAAQQPRACYALFHAPRCAPAPPRQGSWRRLDWWSRQAAGRRIGGAGAQPFGKLIRGRDPALHPLPRPPALAAGCALSRTRGWASRRMKKCITRSRYLGVESVRGGDGFGLTVSYWRDEAAILGWKHQMEHAAVRNRGRRDWYTRYITRVAKVERDYDWVRRDAGPG